jgi:hypothetical protein
MTVVLASAPVTDWPERLLLTALLALLLMGVVGLLRLGWVRRGRRQHDIPALPPVPPLPPEGLAVSGVPARYLGTTRAGDWLDRVVVHGLGVPSAAQVAVGADGVWCLRTGAPDVFIPADRLVAARHDRGHAGKVYESGGVLVLTWRHGAVTLETGLRVRDPAAAEDVRRSAMGAVR